MSPIEYSIEDNAAIVRLNDVENRNALSVPVMDALADALSAAESDSNVRALVLGHHGNTFCAGADLSAVDGAKGTEAEVAQRSRGRMISGLFRRIIEIPKPVIAEINGHVRGGGMGLTAACDIVVASSSSTFGLTEVRVGVWPAMISPYLSHRIARPKLSEWYLRGHKFSADEAQSGGLVNHVSDDAHASVKEILGDVVKGAPGALALAKMSANAELLEEVARTQERLIDLSAEAFVSEEGQEGIRAFRAKRLPHWIEALKEN